MQFTTRRARITVDVPHIAFISTLAAFCAWYLYDARLNSADFADLLLIQPIAIGVFLVYFYIVCNAVTVERHDVAAPAALPERERIERLAAIRIFGSMALVTLYVVSLNWIGFDVATFCYVAASLLLLGERRWWVVVLMPVLFCGICVLLFNELLQMPLPLSLVSVP